MLTSFLRLFLIFNLLFIDLLGVAHGARVRIYNTKSMSRRVPKMNMRVEIKPPDRNRFQ